MCLGPHHLARARRLRKRWQFESAYRRGARASGPGLRLVVAPNGGPEPRLGCAIGKKVGSAVIRNRVRRLLRETFRLQAGHLPAVDIIVTVLPGYRPTGLQGVQNDFLPLLERSLRRRGRS